MDHPRIEVQLFGDSEKGNGSVLVGNMGKWREKLADDLNIYVSFWRQSRHERLKLGFIWSRTSKNQDSHWNAELMMISLIM